MTIKNSGAKRVESIDYSIKNIQDVKASYLGDVFILRDEENDQCIQVVTKSGEVTEKCSSEISGMKNLELYGKYGGILFVNNNRSVSYTFNRGCKWSKMLELESGNIISSASNRANNHMAWISYKHFS